MTRLRTSVFICNVCIMSLDNPNLIDALGIDISNGQTVSTIVDAYFSFVERNQIAEVEPAWRDKGARLEVIFLHQPSDSAVLLLKTAEFVARHLNLNVKHRVQNG